MRRSAVARIFALRQRGGGGSVISDVQDRAGDFRMQDMPSVTELERRIAAALDRIGQGLTRLPPKVAAPDPAPVQPAPREEPDADHRTAAQLAERLRAVKEREAKAAADAEARIADLTEARDRQGIEVQRLRRTVAMLREALQTQTDAARAGLTDPAAINRTMAAELDALRAQRRSEADEIEAILSELAPLIQEQTAHA
jgi:hypothetical protein